MGASIRAQELRELLVLAGKLRNFADASGDPRTIDLFNETAEALESRAARVAETPAGCGANLDVSC